MHEMGIVSGIIDAVVASAQDAGATRVLAVNVRIGDMTEVVDEALEFAYDALSEGTMCEGAPLNVEKVSPRSLCLECFEEFDHDRFHRACTHCGSYEKHLIAGREMEIVNIEVELPD